MSLGCLCSAAATAVQLGVLAYLFARNRFFDRLNAVNHVPIAALSALQTALWFVAEERATCSLGNRVLSAAVAVVVLTAPLYTLAVAKACQRALQSRQEDEARRLLTQGCCPGSHQLCAFATYDPGFYCSECSRERIPLQSTMWGCRECDFDVCGDCYRAASVGKLTVAPTGGLPMGLGRHPQTHLLVPAWAPALLGPQPALWCSGVPKMLRRATNRMLVNAALFTLLSLIYLSMRVSGAWSGDAGRAFFAGPQCAALGSHGLLVWPLVVWDGFPVCKLVAVLAYALVSGGYAMQPKPSYAPGAVNCVCMVSILLFMKIGDQSACVCAWWFSCLCLVYVAEPWLFSRFRVFDPELWALPDDARRRRPLFYAARMHWLQEMQPHSGKAAPKGSAGAAAA